jgi:alkylation response protein AidB-like acyl-CoA dehydrogenase
MDETHPGRDLLRQWEASKPSNFYADHKLLRGVVARAAGMAFDEGDLLRFGAQVAGPMDRAARENDRLTNHPRLERFDGIGTRTEEVVFHPTYREVGRSAYEAGLVAGLAKPGNTWKLAALFYLLAHDGEAGHACPITCTAGLVRALQQKGSKDLREKYLPGLLDPSYDRHLVGSQFLTEVQGGSDVGANLVRAIPDPDRPGVFRVSGEKWFCSVSDADLFLVTARPEGAPPGTRGLGCFLVPRRLDDGSPNAFSLRRLKDKIGTRTMASGEMDFDGAVAYPIGKLDEGFKIAVGIVLNTSRFYNALGSSGAARRAYVEALTFARAREAFGAPIHIYPLVRETLARIKAEAAASLVSTFHLAELIDAVDTGRASDDDVKAHRLLVNANKYWTSLGATDAVHLAIEILGGNGTIETFSVLPRLYRDAIVMESWEGSHNVLCLQVLRDAAKLGLLAVHDRRLKAIAEEGAAANSSMTHRVITAWEETKDGLARCLADPLGHGQIHVKRHLETLMQEMQVLLLLRHAAGEKDKKLAAETAALAEVYFLRYRDRSYRPDADPGYLARINAALGDDLPG